MGYNLSANDFSFGNLAGGAGAAANAAFSAPDSMPGSWGGMVPGMSGDLTPDVGGLAGINVPTPFIPQGGGGIGGFLTDPKKMGLLLGGLNTIGGLYGAFKAASLANQQFKFQKAFSTANLANQIQTYNTTLEDRARNRAFVQGNDHGAGDAYYQSHKLATPKLG